MTVDEYLKKKISPDQRATVATVRRLMREAAPAAKETIAYGTLGWKIQGIIAVINPTKNYLAVAFLRVAEFEDKYGILEGIGRRQKLLKVSYNDIHTTALRYYIRQAVQLDSE